MKKLLSLVPWLCLGLFAVEMAAVMAPRKSGDLHTAEFGKLPVMMGGRVQPLDSVARNALLQIRSTSDVPLEMVPSWKFWHHPEKLRSSEWLLEVFFKPEVADTRPIFLIHHPDLLSEFDLEEKGIEKSGLRYYTFQEIATIWDGVTERARHASEVEDAQRTSYQKQVLKLYNVMALYQRLKNSVQPEGM
ncbi:MAG TPA: hypothetical protein PKH32_09385, partial [Verrucomicrobiota bacterium]|nr:hypothetical protein [Verrucomicrobiota bacterium]